MQVYAQDEVWTRKFGFTGRMAVNMSVQRCDVGMIERNIDEAFKASGITPSRPELGLARSVLLADR